MAIFSDNIKEFKNRNINDNIYYKKKQTEETAANKLFSNDKFDSDKEFNIKSDEELDKKIEKEFDDKSEDQSDDKSNNKPDA